MRAAILLLLVAGVVWRAATLETHRHKRPAVPLISPWRRTLDGWERADIWFRSPSTPNGEICLGEGLPHPATVALAELIAASLFLLGGSAVQNRT